MRATKYQDGRTGIWYLSFDKEGKRVRKSTGTKAIEITDALDEYEKHAKTYKADNTVKVEGLVLRKFFRNVPDIQFLHDLQTKHVNDQLVAMLERGASAKTRLNVRVTLHAFYEWARELGMCGRTPSRTSRLRSCPKRRSGT